MTKLRRYILSGGLVLVLVFTAAACAEPPEGEPGPTDGTTDGFFDTTPSPSDGFTDTTPPPGADTTPEVSPGPTDGGEVSGPILDVDATLNTITMFDENAVQLDLTVDPTTVITVDGQPATLADLEIGMNAMVTYDPESKVVMTIEVKGAEGETPTPGAS